MKITFALLVAVSPFFSESKATLAGGEWSIVRTTKNDPVELSTSPLAGTTNAACRAVITASETVTVAHAVFKARILPGTMWFQALAGGGIVYAGSSPDGQAVRVLAADAAPLTLAHVDCAVTLTQSLLVQEPTAFEYALIEAGRPARSPGDRFDNANRVTGSASPGIQPVLALYLGYAGLEERRRRHPPQRGLRIVQERRRRDGTIHAIVAMACQARAVREHRRRSMPTPPTSPSRGGRIQESSRAGYQSGQTQKQRHRGMKVPPTCDGTARRGWAPKQPRTTIRYNTKRDKAEVPCREEPAPTTPGHGWYRLEVVDDVKCV